MATEWPAALPAVQLRIARPTHQLARVVDFYHHALGLPLIYSYMDDAEYDGVMIGLPGRDYHLEITRHIGDGPCPEPPPDNLLVFYMLDKTAIDQVVARLRAMDYQPVAARNPYWATHGITFRDPDGWHVVLMNTPGFGEDVG
jgi:catechol 2,3-dioxygenase-like lactoylglutathione lyase family enzyme